ncbi:MAG TPA: preprotein translocase subunit SecY [Bryobacteraceae bacterium]|nr:preprotein translocase subunit SecY [Bryobacteraceae bacterium]HPQ16012.1 preprotein translocase subunit SecY [Bryobacteraceae bacterium]HPU70619.1 preprotein translocase subunit SecY [Bryobacteraceae bacterium]
MNKFFEAIANIFRIPDLRKRVLFTLAILAVYRLGGHIPTPGIDGAKLDEFFQQNQGTVFGFIDLFSGGMFRRLTIFALGIMPYITASIILQLLTVVIPTLEKLQKEGELGRRKITQWTRYLTLGLSMVQSFGIATALMSSEGGFVLNPGVGFIAMTVLTLTTGSVFIMWLGEQISERGIGNGMSLIIFAGIVVGLPRAIEEIYTHVFVTRQWTALHLIIILTVMLAVVAFIVLVERGERRIPVQYAKRVVGRRMMGGQATHLPLKVNAGGVMPVIFASSILTFPQTLALVPAVKNNPWLSAMLASIQHSQPLYVLLYVAGIMFFAFFYVSIIFNPNEAADNMRKYGGFVPGIRPGKNTAEYMNRILTRITVVGGLYLALLSLIPEIMISGIKLQSLPLIGDWIDTWAPRWLLDGLGVNFYFGGTSLLIVVGVAMDTVNQIEAQLIMRHYEGFSPRAGRIRGRRSVF